MLRSLLKPLRDRFTGVRAQIVSVSEVTVDYGCNPLVALDTSRCEIDREAREAAGVRNKVPVPDKGKRTVKVARVRALKDVNMDLAREMWWLGARPAALSEAAAYVSQTVPCDGQRVACIGSVLVNGPFGSVVWFDADLKSLHTMPTMFGVCWAPFYDFLAVLN